MSEPLHSPPLATALEVSLFGCGVGECLAVHLGNGDWMLVDACRTHRQDLPLNLAYLEKLGLDLNRAVKLFVITHWHDDHIDGAAEIVKRCPDARICFSSALCRDEFFRLVACYAQTNSIVDRERSGVREMGRILKILRERKKADPRYHPPVLTQADHLLHRTGNCRVIALSPSPEAVIKAYEDISQIWKNLTEAQTRFVLRPPARNHNAIALWVREDEERRVLLGADLEDTEDALTGWSAVLQCQHFPDGKALIFKIPHHGAPNGDSAEVWNELVAEKPIAILTTYGRGGRPRPSEHDLRRISQRAGEIYCTTLPRGKPPKRDRAVERTLREVVKKRRVVVKAAGHIRIRWDRQSPPRIALFGNAIKIESPVL